MSTAISDWDNEYARLARAASQQRTSGMATAAGDAASLQQGLQRLDQALVSGSLSSVLQPAEIQRRRRLIQHLQQTSLGGGSTPGNNVAATAAPGSGGMIMGGAGQQQSQMAMAMQQQDAMIDDLATGVSRLRNQTAAIGDEARLHVSLMNDMENNLDAAQAGLEGETRRAARLREDTSIWRLQMIVAGLCVLLVLLILMGIAP